MSHGLFDFFRPVLTLSGASLGVIVSDPMLGMSECSLDVSARLLTPSISSGTCSASRYVPRLSPWLITSVSALFNVFRASVWMLGVSIVSQSVDLGQNNNPNTTPTKDYENVQVVVYLRSVQRGCAEEGERGSTPTG